ncbi:MAG: hypothetical protein EHM19_02975 [Candidatus Latescibacterota bacterium]|nr:MAG: hypothetical protein EHM19_02975 [Candidatus Latescibacterota bacterium]
MTTRFASSAFAAVLAAFVSAPIAAADPVFEWDDVYDGGVQQPDAGVAALTDADGNLVVAGESNDGVGGADMLVRKIDRETGLTTWERRVSADDGNDMLVGGIVRDGDGNFLVGGTRQGCYG